MKTYIGYCQKRLTDAEGYDAEAEALIHGLHDEFSGLHGSQSENFMLDMFLDSHVFDWAFAYNNKQIYKVNSDGTRGDLLLDIGGREGIEANAAASEYHEYATTHFTQALKADTVQPHDERLSLRIAERIPVEREARLQSLAVFLGDVGNRDLNLPLTPHPFDPDVMSYRNTTRLGSTGYWIEAIPMATGATVAGDVGMLTYDADGENTFTVTVTSQDGVASRTYTVLLGQI